MKRLLWIIIGLALYTHAMGQNQILDQKITVAYKDFPLEAVLNDLGEKTGIDFSYSSSKIPVTRKVNYQANNKPVSTILEEILSDFPVKYQVNGGNRVIITYSDLKQNVRGRLIDKDTHSPIFGANVIIVGSSPLLGSSTDEEGYFRISNVPIGRHQIRVNYIGYRPYEASILVGSGKEVVLNLEIVESVVRLEEIVVTSGRYISEPKNDMATVSGRSFTAEETKRYAAAVGDPARLVLAYAGVVQADDGTNEIVIRGNSPRGLLWKLEGVEIPSPNHFSSEGASAGGISMFSTHMIAQSDFFTGAFPSEYGNALSGVFDIYFRKGNNEKHEKTIQAGFLGLDVSAEGPMSTDGKSSYLFNYRYSTLAILDAIGLNLQDENESNTFQDLSMKFHWDTDKAGSFTLFGLGGLSKFKENIANAFNDLEIYNMGVVGLNHQISLNKSTYLKSSASIAATHLEDDFQRFRETPDVTKEVTTFDKSYTRFSSTLGTKINARHFLEFGAIYSLLNYNFRRKEVNTFNQSPFTDIDRFNDEGNSSTLQGFAAYKLQITDDVSLVTGLHTMHFAFTGETTLEPRAGLKWQINEKQSINAGFGVHSRIESLEYYLSRYVNLDGTTTQWNEDLEITKSRHYVLGYNRTLAPNLFMKIETYYQDLYDVPVIRSTVDDDLPLAPAFSSILFADGYTVYPLQNTGTARNYGVEMTLEKAFSNDYYFIVTGALYESKYTGADGIERDSRYAGKFNNSILAGKEFKMGASKTNTFGINVKSLWSGNQMYSPIDLEASNAAGFEIINIEDVFTESYPNYFRLDLQFNFRINKPKFTSEWRLDIQNLTGRENVLADFYDPQSQRVVFETQLGTIPVLSYRIEF